MLSFLSHLVLLSKSSKADKASDKPSPDYRAQIAARLRGQKITVPDVLLIYKGWTPRKHTDTDKIEAEIEAWYQLYIPTEKQRVKQRKVGAALITGLFWSRCSSENLRILLSLMAWFFFWDDEMDDGGDISENKDKAEAYCNDTTAFIKSCLQPELGIKPPAPGRLHNSGAFVDLGKAMQTGQSKKDRDVFANSIYNYIDSVRSQQDQRQTGLSPLAEYIERRVVTIASAPCVAVLTWAYGLTLPSWFWDHEAVKRVDREGAMSIFLQNDLMSLVKELKNDEVDSTVPILVFTENLTAQQAVDRVIDLLRQSYDDFLAAASRLREAASNEDQKIKNDVNTWIDGAMDAIVGNYVWGMATPRYIPRSAFKQGLEFELVL